MKRPNLIRMLSFLLCLAAMLFGGWKLWGIYAEYHAGTQAYDDLADQYTAPASAPDSDAPAPSDGMPQVDFAALQADCPDVVAWIYAPDSKLNYPIVQSADNDYYLRRLMNGAYNIGGTIFMDYRNQADFSDWNTIIYGHKMKNGSMFGSLPYYREEGYYEEHTEIYMFTPEQNFRLELLGGYVTPADAQTYTFPVNAQERDALAELARSKSTFAAAETELGPEDKLVTLSTCVYDYEDARYVLVGVLRPVEEAA